MAVTGTAMSMNIYAWPFQDRPTAMMAFFIHAPNTIEAQSGENTEEEAERTKKLRERSIMKGCFLDMAHPSQHEFKAAILICI